MAEFAVTEELWSVVSRVWSSTGITRDVHSSEVDTCMADWSSGLSLFATSKIDTHKRAKHW